MLGGQLQDALRFFAHQINFVEDDDVGLAVAEQGLIQLQLGLLDALDGVEDDDQKISLAGGLQGLFLFQCAHIADRIRAGGIHHVKQAGVGALVGAGGAGKRADFGAVVLVLDEQVVEGGLAHVGRAYDGHAVFGAKRHLDLIRRELDQHAQHGGIGGEAGDEGFQAALVGRG